MSFWTFSSKAEALDLLSIIARGRALGRGSEAEGHSGMNSERTGDATNAAINKCDQPMDGWIDGPKSGL